jgi:antitoxin ParD1/3/4
MPKRTVPPSAKLKALREAARLGFDALDRGEFKEFSDVGELERYLRNLSDQVIFKRKSPRSPQ